MTTKDVHKGSVGTVTCDTADDERQAQAEENERIRAHFEQLLDSYACSQGLNPGSLGMTSVETALLKLVRNGANEVHLDCILVALAGVAGTLDIYEFSMDRSGVFRPILCHFRMRRARKRALKNASSWLVFDVKCPSSEYQSDQQVHESTQELLSNLLKSYFSQ